MTSLWMPILSGLTRLAKTARIELGELGNALVHSEAF
jgi:hypothetical protein